MMTIFSTENAGDRRNYLSDIRGGACFQAVLIEVFSILLAQTGPVLDLSVGVVRIRKTKSEQRPEIVKKTI